jgi:hypothetical protein
MNVLITHYDLDGVASAIIMHQGMKFDKMFKGGYHKFDDFIKWTPQGANVVVADCSFSVDQFARLKQKANKIIFIDHHPDSLAIKETFTNDIVIFDKEKAGAGLCLDFIQSKKKLNKEFHMLANAANHYDLFNRESEPDWFKFGYDLNILFWEYHFDDFFARFKNGFQGFLAEEKDCIKAAKLKRDKDIADSSFIPMGESIKGLFCVPTVNNIINDIPYGKPGYEVYYIITRYAKSTSVSVRCLNKDIDLTDYVKYAESLPQVSSAGGHPQASGITFKGIVDDEVIVEAVQLVQQQLDNGKKFGVFDADDIPF